MGNTSEPKNTDRHCEEPRATKQSIMNTQEMPSGVFFNEDAKRLKLQKLRERLENGSDSFLDKNDAPALSKMLNFFSAEQIALLLEMMENKTEKIGEGIQIREDLKHFEKLKVEPVATPDRPPIPKELFHLFRGLVQRFYTVMAHFVNEKEAKIRAVIKVAWTIVSDAEQILHHAAENDTVIDEKTMSRIKRQFLQVEQELDVLDPKSEKAAH